MDFDWARLLVEQLEFYWGVHLRPRLAGLTDAEYLWEPVAGCWSVRQYAKDPMAALVVHINREVIHHGGEICLLRDLYRSSTRGRGLRCGDRRLHAGRAGQ